MSRSKGSLVVVVVALAAAAAAAAAPPKGTPDPSAIALTAAAFPGAVDGGTKATGASGPNAASFQAKTVFPTPYGRSKYVLLVSTAIVAKDAAGAALEYAGISHELSSKAGQAAFVKGFLAGAKLKPADVRVAVLKAHGLGTGDASVETGFVFTGKASKRKSDLSVSAVLLDRIVALNVAGGVGARVVPADAAALARIVVASARPKLAPVVVAQPTVTGTPQQGQTLTASNGTWGNTIAGFAYQWQRCDATGTCADVPGATAATYAVQPDDVGSTLRIEVTGSNRFGSAPADSAATAAVS